MHWQGEEEQQAEVDTAESSRPAAEAYMLAPQRGRMHQTFQLSSRDMEGTVDT